MKFPDAKILIFCKAPTPGQVKTRLTPHLTFNQAAELHQQLANETINLTQNSDLCCAEIWCSPNIDHVFFQTFELKLKQQEGKDLGERMSNAFKTSLHNNSAVLIVGTDSPSLSVTIIEQALSSLQSSNDVVLAPAEDGGYTLIGLKEIHPSIFENIDWGTENVFDQTIKKINELNLKLHTLPMQWDLDRPEDLQRYLDSKNNKS